jgi:hypothetical protein
MDITTTTTDISGTATTTDISGTATEIISYTLTDNTGKTFDIDPLFVWNIRRMDVMPSFNGMTNVVKCIHWTYVVTATVEDVVYSAYYTDIANLLPPESQFTQYEKLTKEMVVEWLDNIVDLPKIKNIVIANLQNNFAPPIVSLPLPF